MNPIDDPKIRAISMEIYDAVGDVLCKYDKETGDKAFEVYLNPYILQVMLTGKLDTGDMEHTP